MATQADIRQRIYNNLYSAFPNESPFVALMGAAYDNSATTVTAADGTKWSAGDTLENPATGEQMRVISVSTNTLTVVRGWNNTTKAASSGSADPVLKNPRFTQAQVDDAIASTLAYLEGWGIHVFGTGQLTRDTPVTTYDMDTEMSITDVVPTIGVCRVFYERDNTKRKQTLPFLYYRDLDDNFLEILDWGEVSDGETVDVVYAKRIDDVADLLARQEELVVAGATALLLGATIVPSTHDPGTRTDRTVAPGQTSRDVRYFQARFFTEARVEAALLSVERQKMMPQQRRVARARRWVS